MCEIARGKGRGAAFAAALVFFVVSFELLPVVLLFTAWGPLIVTVRGDMGSFATQKSPRTCIMFSRNAQ